MSIKEIQKLYQDNVLVQLKESEKITSGGIVIPDNVGSSKSLALVIKCGDGYTDMQTGKFTPLTVRPGDTVSLSSSVCNDATELLLDEGKLYLIIESDIDVIVSD